MRSGFYGFDADQRSPDKELTYYLSVPVSIVVASGGMAASSSSAFSKVRF